MISLKLLPRLYGINIQRTLFFRNGYGYDKPEFTAECSISEGYGDESWGAEKNKKYYVLTIHRIFNKKNIKTG